MNIRSKTREKYSWYWGCAKGNGNRLVPVEFSPKGRSAIECFHMLETYGTLPPTREPDTLGCYLNGKATHGITVAAVAEDFVGRVIFSAEIKANYPAWVAEEIFQLASKVAEKTLGFVPTFVRNRKDFSEFDTVALTPAR